MVEANLGNRIASAIIKYYNFRDGKPHSEEEMKSLKLKKGMGFLNKFFVGNSWFSPSVYKVDANKIIDGFVSIGIPKDESGKLVSLIDSSVFFGSRNGKVMHITKLFKDGKETGNYEIKYKSW
jgi:hypothetical protein